MWSVFAVKAIAAAKRNNRGNDDKADKEVLPARIELATFRL